MDSKKTVLFVAPYFPPHSGGVERYVSEIVKNIDKDTWNPVVLTTSDGGQDTREEFAGCMVHRLQYDFQVSNTPFSFQWFLKVRYLLRDVAPDVVNVHMPVPGLGDVTALVLPRAIPLVVTYHGESMKKGSLVADVLVWLYEHVLLRYVLHRARHIICSSDSIRLHFLKSYMHKSTTILPGVDTEVFVPNEKIKNSKPTVLFVAGLGKGDDHKGLKILLRAIKKVRAVIPDVQLVVVGDGTRRSYFEKKVIERGLEEVVQFKGRLHGRALVEEYQKAHLFVLPTKNESFGMVIAEAMATGLPVVSTQVGGVPLLVDTGVTGTLVEVDDTSALTAEIISFLRDPEKSTAFGIAGRKKVEEGFSWVQRAKAYATVFTEAETRHQTIAHIVGYYPPHLGGMEVVASEVAKELARKGYDVRVFTSTLGGKIVETVERHKNYILRRLQSSEFAHTPILWSLPFHLLVLPQGTILHVHLAQAGIPEIALLVAKIRGFRTVIHFHLDVEPSGKLGPLFLQYKKHVLGIVLRRADRVLTFSEEQKEFIHTTYAVQRDVIHTIPNGIGSVYFKIMHTKKSDVVRLLSVGRLTVQKRIDRIIAMFPLLTFDAKLTIVGEGEDREALEILAAKTAPKKVIFTGKKSPKQVRNHYRNADIFLIPSDKEGMPMVVLEAMAAGVPVVASNVFGLREVVGGVGELVDNPSPESFANTLNVLVRDEEKRNAMRERGRAFTRELSWPVVVSKIEVVYTNI
ncbi:TPA: hypothetical protein DEP58_03745 [Patescibacteria group bacterium]|nr:MAG: hypothetical protein UU98_C0008G0003 [Parcubacteria group bacterium GW2011_GWD2_42_14]HCC05387.1 hypothetical protein [Patescibacteria group bacterium]